MSLSDLITILQIVGGDPVVVVALAVIAYFLYKLYNVLNDLKGAMVQKDKDDALFQLGAKTQLDSHEKILENYGERINILEKGHHK